MAGNGPNMEGNGSPRSAISGFGTQINDLVITAIKDDNVAGRMLRTVELKTPIAGGGAITRTVVVDTDSGRLLDDLVLDAGNAQRTLSAVRLGYPLPADRLRTAAT